MGVVWSSNYTLTVAERAEEKVFFTACEHGNLKLVEECLRNTPRLALAEDKLTANATGLHWASLYSLGDSIGVIDALLKAGAAVEAVDSDQRQTPLHLAAGNGRLDAVLALLAAGAERHAMNKHGVTPVDKARAAHQTAVINAFETVQRPPPQLSHPEQVRVESTRPRVNSGLPLLQQVELVDAEQGDDEPNKASITGQPLAEAGSPEEEARYTFVSPRSRRAQP
eukprot:TRINITY_DN1668_c0_g1_i3.p1 TRINITY_DN1668_c0_g1~~TRINITY_DN1668_c0_g1_i3.p1  ORF type:complete len:225 (-),score=38.71 TRINITY_DN1668_c0_g1_i3:254-928(-)